MVIDATSIETFPSEIIEILENHFKVLPDSDKEKIKNSSAENMTEAQCKLESYFIEYKNEQLFNNLKTAFEKHQIVLYHASMIKNINLFFENGIVPVNDIGSFTNDICDYLINNGIDKKKASKTKRLIREEYARKFGSEPSKVCFFANPVDLSKYVQFCENIGGELTNFALSANMENELNVLRNGNPVLIKFTIDFAEICSFNKDKAISSFIYWYASKYFWDKEFDLDFDGSLEGYVPADKIVEIKTVNLKEFDIY